MKKNLSLIVAVVLVVSAINVFAVISSSSNTSIKAVAQSNICTAQGDFMPAPYDNVIVEDALSQDTKLICSAQGDIRPPSWDDEEDDKEESS
ncbi:MAG: hypothetical protein K9N07_03705 [Candidatus Cloacimonetes bacterium]|nr:hypothetical protein [Candidatus Cloacimonadota bacterium]